MPSTKVINDSQQDSLENSKNVNELRTNEVEMLRKDVAKKLNITVKSVDRLCKKGKLKKQNIDGKVVIVVTLDQLAKIAEERNKAKKPSVSKKAISKLEKVIEEMNGRMSTVEKSKYFYEKHGYLISLQQKIETVEKVGTPAWKARASKAKKDFTGYLEICVEDNDPMIALEALMKKLEKKHSKKL